jgi:hypothetical protein
MQRRSGLLPEDYGESLGLEFLGTKMIKGVEFAEYKSPGGETQFRLVYPDGKVDSMKLVDVYGEGNLALGLRNGIEYMVDDEGIHERNFV